MRAWSLSCRASTHRRCSYSRCSQDSCVRSKWLADPQRKQTAKIDALADAAKTLLAETVSARAPSALQEPMWGTWTMERFVLAIQALARQYVLSLAHIELLVPQLCTVHAAEPPSVRNSAEALLAQKRVALEAFVRLPYLHPSGLSGAAPAFAADADAVTGTSRHFLEHVCGVEVRGWIA